MRFPPLLALALAGACDERPPDERALQAHLPQETHKRPVERGGHVTVEPDPVADPSVDNRNSPALQQSGQFDLAEERATLARVIDARVERVEQKIDTLEKRGGAGAKDAVALFRAKRDQARAKLGELDKTTADDWVAYRRDVFSAWDELERELDAALVGQQPGV